MLAFASSDLTIGLVDAKSLRVRKGPHLQRKKKKKSHGAPLGETMNESYIKTHYRIKQPVLQVKKAHEFAITSLAFNRTGRYLASAGADTRCRITRVPDDRELRSRSSYSRVADGLMPFSFRFQSRHADIRCPLCTTFDPSVAYYYADDRHPLLLLNKRVLCMNGIYEERERKEEGRQS